MIFSKEKVNTGRQIEFDLAKGFSAILMVLCHVGIYLGDNTDKLIYTFSDIIGSEFAAPVFMMLMGMSIIYSKHQDSKTMFKRGINLLLSGYLLSSYRTLLFRFIFGNIDEWTEIASFFVIDILQFAGLTFLLLAFLKKIKIPTFGIFILSIIMVFIDQYFILNVPAIDNLYLASFLNLFIPITEWSCFPFFTWFFFPAFGLLFGEFLVRCNNKKKLYSILLPISLCAVIYVYYKFYIYYPDYASKYYFGGNFYYMGLKNVLINALFVMFALSFWYFIGNALTNKIMEPLNYIGKNLNVFYIFSWIYIALLIHLKAYFNITLSRAITIILMILITLICYYSTKFHLKKSNK